MRVLVVEDDSALADFLRRSLVTIECIADVALTGQEARELLKEGDYDILLLDLNLPDIDGLDLLQQIRAQREALPVIALTSRREVADRVKTLDLGVDDYLPKPFAFAELAARMRALLRRARHPEHPVLRVGDLELDRLERRASRGGKAIDLSPKELSLLEYLMQNQGQCVTRSMIIENVWRLPNGEMTNVVDVYVNYLRKKIDEGFGSKLIHTVRGSGYKMHPGGPEH